MPVTGPALARLRKTVRRHLKGGWDRAVFARPGDDDPEAAETVEGPGAGRAPDEATLDALLDRAEAAARQGRVKHTYVLDARTRVRIDARHGKAKVQVLDEATVHKVMGGKDRPLRPDRSADLLRAIGIMNPDGSISARHAKKYKQVNHLVELCRPTWQRLVAARTPTPDAPLRILDLACGNSYLTFVLAHALRQEGIAARLHGVDVRDDVVERSRRRAAALGYDELGFTRASIDAVPPDVLGGPPDLVVALHACDTATDDAIALALRLDAPALFVAPCCQHELAAQLPRRGPAAPLGVMLREGLLRQEYAALVTDALRIELLDRWGYKVDVLEFVAATHTPKNLLIRAHRRPGPPRPAHALAWLSDHCATLGIHPHLLTRLQPPTTPDPNPG